MEIDAKITELESENASLKAEISDLKNQIQWLTEQMKLAKKRQFGASSEQTSDGQLCIFNEAEQNAVPDAPEPEISEVKAHYRKRTRLTTDKLPEDLPVEIVEYDLTDDEKSCPACGTEMRRIGREVVREELKIIPAKAVLVQHVTFTYACRNCELTDITVPIVKAKAPNPVIKGGFASPEAVAHIATQKFVMGSPLYRQEQEWKSQGILLSRQTMSNWLIKASHDWLEPIYGVLKQRLVFRNVLHADETTLQVLKEAGKTAQSKSYMWLYRTSGDAEHPIILYDYQPDRKAVRPAEFLKDFSGYLHTDGYEVYHRLPENITIVGCWAHLRRKFDEALKTIQKDKQPESEAARGLNYCNRLFLLEKQFALLCPEERLKERELQSKPLMDEFYAWMDALRAVPQTLIGKAKHYALKQRKYLERYLLDGRLELSNNRAERSIKPFVIGRKNWLFANTTNGARASAVLYSVIETAKESGLNPFEYLTYVFRTAPNLDLTLPENVKLLLPENAPDSCRNPNFKSDKPPWEQ